MSEQKETPTLPASTPQVDLSDVKKTTRVLNPKTANNVVANDFTESPAFKQSLVYFTDYDSFFYWTDNRYFRKLTQRDLEKIVLRFCETAYPRQGFTSSQISDIISLIKLKILREEKKEATNLIAFKDCLYNTRTFITLESSPEHLVTWNLPYNLSDLDTPTPIFDKFLQTSLVEAKDHSVPDYELINLVQEMMGFLMTDTFYATGAFFLYGVGANGKSVLSSLIERIFGDEYVSAMSLADFNKPFAVGDIINKRVNISNEEDERFISGKMFKVLITGESLRGEHKFGNGYKMRSSCKFLFSTNKLPTFDGLDYGLKRRIFLIPFYRQFKPNEQDKFLIEKLTAEIPGIIGWAIKGAKRLAENNYVFSQSSSSNNIFSEFEEEMSSAIMFFNENYIVDDDYRTSRQELYEEYNNWCRQNGKKGVSSSRKFNKELMENINKINDQVYCKIENQTFRAYNCRPSKRDARRSGDDNQDEFNINNAEIISDPEAIQKIIPGLYDAK